MGRVEDMDKRIEEFKSMGRMDELHGEMQAAMSSVVADFKKELQALQASGAAKDGELQAYRPRLRRMLEALVVPLNKLKISLL